MNAQVFVSHSKPEPHLIEPVISETFWKPRGGLWTSTLSETGGQWVDWLDGQYSLEDARWGGRLWLLEPRTNANVAVIWGPDELYEFARRFPYPERFPGIRSFEVLIDWVALASEYDAVHIPNPWPWRFGNSDMAASMFFYVMDAECTCWFRWCFEGEPITFTLEELTDGASPIASRLRRDVSRNEDFAQVQASPDRSQPAGVEQSTES